MIQPLSTDLDLAPLGVDARRDGSLEDWQVKRWGMTATTAYTPLETLLVFQSLAKYGTDPSSFSRISEVLKGNPLIREGKTFDNGRLSPDALRELYLGLLNEELKKEDASRKLGDLSDDGSVGLASNASPKKRKLQSPPLPSIRDASQKSQLLPHLVTRLYARYQQYMIRGIREEERRYQNLQRDIDAVERGEWDGQAQRQNSGTPSERRPIGKNTIIESQALDTTTQNPGPLADPQETIENLINIEEGQSRSSIGAGNNDTIIRHDPLSGPQSGQTRAISSRNQDQSSRASPGIAPLVQSQAQHHPPGPGQFAPSRDYVPPSARSSVATGTSPQALILPPTISRKQGSPHIPPASHGDRPFPSPPHPEGVSSSRPSLHPGLPTDVSMAFSEPGERQVQTQATRPHPSSPVVLPPPVGLRPPSGSPTTSYHALANPLGRKYRGPYTSPFPSESNTPTASGYGLESLPAPDSGAARDMGVGEQSGTGSPMPQSYFHNSLSSPAQQSANLHAQSPSFNQPFRGRFSPIQSGPSLPSIQNAQTARNFDQPERSTIISEDSAHVPLQKHANQTTFLPRPTHVGMSDRRHSQVSTPSHQPLTPLASGDGKYRGRRPLPLETPSSTTRWKPSSNVGPARPSQSPAHPPHSPLSDPGSPSPLHANTRSVSDQKTGSAGYHYSSMGTADDQDRELRKTRSGRPKNLSSIKTRRRTASSSASSAVRGPVKQSTRSPSLASHVDDLSRENDEILGASKIKNEPPQTPAGVPGGDDTELDDEPTVKEGKRSSTRLRRGTLEGYDMNDGRGLGKRKRSIRGTPDTVDTGRDVVEDLPSVAEPRSIHSTRNFSRTTAPLLNGISAHKYAGFFAGPVKEKDAPGYKDIISRPQDLKSIKSAIAAGSRAVAAAVDATETPTESVGASSAGPPGSSTPSKNLTVRLAPNPDIIPPKGIVNSLQLEKELIRMFANAVMFNPDPDRGYERVLEKRKEDGYDEYQDLTLPTRSEDDEGAVVKYTRDMFGVVKNTVDDWRAAEQASEGLSGRAQSLKGKQGPGRDGGGDDDDADELAERNL
ncbi:MAG: hypothetical protein M1837_002568 [Sclerophora amabilis]|nr:MAG: hypothetical protein M1837_002568 [Sclerophora amabilis]